MLLGRFQQTPLERKRYTIEYSDWLDTGETVTSTDFSVETNTDTPLVVDDVAVDIDGTLVVFYVSGGEADADYKVLALIGTSGGQDKEDSIIYAIRDT